MNTKISQQHLIALQITRLKGLANVRIGFDEQRPLTAIMGPNGFGKSTVLHALAAAFRPLQSGQEDWRFTDFFPNTPHGIWSGTMFTVINRFRSGADVKTEQKLCWKGTGQWLPRSQSRPVREVHYIGVDSAVPSIERYTTRRAISFHTQVLTDAKSNALREKVGAIFNKSYTEYHRNEISSRHALMGVKAEGIVYSSLSMGAGEQRVFHILQRVENAGKYALILIDEIDLLLHTEALHRFLETLNTYATDKNLQILFTTHRETVLAFESCIAVRHLFQTPAVPERTFCFNETKPDAITRLTGEPQRPLAIGCEDDMARAIIEKVAATQGLRPYVEFVTFGSIENSFTLVAALLLSGKPMSNSIFVLDGDKYQTEAARIKQFEKFWSGTETNANERRQQATTYLIQFLPPAGENPEKALHNLIKPLPATGNSEHDCIIRVAQTIHAVQDRHGYIDQMIEKLGYSREVGLTKIVEVAATATGWQAYTREVYEWLEARASTVKESPGAAR